MEEIGKLGHAAKIHGTPPRTIQPSRKAPTRTNMQSRTAHLSTLALFLAGFSLVLDVVAWPTKAEAPEQAGPTVPTHVADSSERIARLEAANRALLERLDRVEQERESARRPAAVAETVRGAELVSLTREALEELVRTEPEVAIPTALFDSAGFEEAVARSLQKIDVDRASQSAQRWVEERSEYLRESMDHAIEQMGMGSSQANQLEAALLAAYEEEAKWEVKEAQGLLETAAQWEEMFTEDYASFLAELGTFLTPEQVDIYLALGDDWAFPFSENESDWEEDWGGDWDED